MILSCTGVMGANDLWGELKSGNHLVLIRHALAPGFSDPEGFDIRDCKTQRNLNDMGRQQSRDIGDLFRLNGISRAVIKSSYWCRCIDTARLLNLGQVSELRSLNSFFEHNERKQEQTDAIMKWIQNASLDTPTVLVSHFVNIAALTDYGPESGEIIFVRRLTNGSITVIGSIPTLK
ncbi:MAG: histidine phosphatase family protein [Magnetovibrio sp.]|nr:histidine phosphatase family protein [Magnetovibrio sp.]